MRVALCRTEQRAFLREYVTTVTMMSSEGAKNACRVVPHGLVRSPKLPNPIKGGNQHAFR